VKAFRRRDRSEEKRSRKSDDKQKPIIYAWLKLVFSLSGIWCFVPGILGMLFVYWADANGYQTFILKGHHEIIAIVLIGGATALFLLRAVCYRIDATTGLRQNTGLIV
jgi:polyferredoxin